MNRLLSLIFLMCFSSCELYNSPFPISEKPSMALEEEFLGEWVICDEENKILEPKASIEIIDWGNLEYLVLVKIFNHENDWVIPVKAWRSGTGFPSIVNLQQLSTNRDTIFNFAGYFSRKKGELFITGLTKDFKHTFKTQQEFSDFYKTNSDEFQKSLRTYLQLVRWNKLTFQIVNSSWVRKINLIEYSNEIVEKESFLPYLDSFHLIKNKGTWKQTPKKFVAWLGVQDSVVILQNNQYIWDKTHDKWYQRISKNNE